jgi:hypothetical protein
MKDAVNTIRVVLTQAVSRDVQDDQPWKDFDLLDLLHIGDQIIPDVKFHQVGEAL